jgi:hypothetical protein
MTAATATPPDTPIIPAPPTKDCAVGVEEAAPALFALLPVASALLVALATYLLCVAATLATEAADADAAGLRGAAALHQEVTVFSADGLSGLLGQLL